MKIFIVAAPMLVALFIAAVTLAVNAGAFFGARYGIARAFRVRDVRVIFGLEHGPWASVSFFRRACFAAAGPVACYVVATTAFSFSFWLHPRYPTDEKNLHVVVLPDSPAAGSGFRNGDRIISVDAVTIHNWSQLQVEIHKHKATSVPVVVERNGTDILLRPEVGPEGRLGVALEVEPASWISILSADLSAPVRTWINSIRGQSDSRRLAEGLLTGRMQVDTWGFLGFLTASYLWIPIVFSLVFFPRKRRVTLPSARG